MHSLSNSSLIDSIIPLIVPVYSSFLTFVSFIKVTKACAIDIILSLSFNKINLSIIFSIFFSSKSILKIFAKFFISNITYSFAILLSIFINFKYIGLE